MNLNFGIPNSLFPVTETPNSLCLVVIYLAIKFLEFI